MREVRVPLPLSRSPPRIQSTRIGADVSSGSAPGCDGVARSSGGSKWLIALSDGTREERMLTEPSCARAAVTVVPIGSVHSSVPPTSRIVPSRGAGSVRIHESSVTAHSVMPTGG